MESLGLKGLTAIDSGKHYNQQQYLNNK